jgi:hypothetical protein
MHLLNLWVILAAAQTTPVGQEEFRTLDGAPLHLAVFKVDKAEGYDEMTLGIRVPFLGGKLDNEGDKWTDVFHSSGIGFNLDGSFLWAASSKVAVGIYTTFELDSFGGKTTTVDLGAGPVDITQDDLLMTRFLVGARVRETFGHFFLDQNMGFGFATYSSSSARANGVSVGVIDSSIVFAFELGARFGFAVSEVVDLGIGLAYNYNGAPSVSNDLSQVDPSLKFQGQSNTILCFFINLNF